MHQTYALILEVRGTFADLRGLSDAMNADLGITAARRAIIEHLATGGAATVPQIAEAKRVTRQHVQIIADELAARGLAAFHDNPAHRRSRLLDLTDAGREAFATIRRREAALLDRLAVLVPPEVSAQGLASLRAFRAGLAEIADGR
jgi:DNA-binding MarR family transcriptional regulator